MFHTFEQALNHLNRFTDYERMSAPIPHYNLERMTRLNKVLGRPDRAFSSLHIAGTKGKGSTAHMAEAILRAAGYRTGLYTSPHLVDLRERIRIDGREVSERDFLWAMNRMEPALRRLRPTFFETMTAAAFVLFARARVDYAVVEVGLGGRLDATNVIRPAACAITTIGYDHTDRLGHTLAQIASEKAGIVKPGVPVVVGPQRPAALAAIRARCTPREVRVRDVRIRQDVVEFTAEGLKGTPYSCTLPVLGAHQAANAAVAIGLVEAAGANAAPGTVRRALRSVRLPGRIEIVARRPWIVVDAAHNPLSARALAEALRGVPGRRRVLVFGAAADKDYAAMLRALLPETDLAVFTRARNPRAADPDALARLARGAAVVASNVGRALATARAMVDAEDRIVVTGSFAVAGEALAALRGR